LLSLFSLLLLEDVTTDDEALLHLAEDPLHFLSLIGLFPELLIGLLDELLLLLLLLE
jgi:hypothetical protein